MDEPPPEHVVRQIALEVVGVRVTKDEDAAVPAAGNAGTQEALPKSSVDGGKRDGALPLHMTALQSHASTAGETNSVGSYSSSEGQHGAWMGAAGAGGNTSVSRTFELVRGMRGLSVDASSSSSSAEWHLANG